MADIKRNPILDAAAANEIASAADQQAKRDISKQMDMRDRAANDATGAIETEAISDKIISAQKSAAAATVDAQNAAARVALSTDWLDMGSRSNRLARDSAENYDKAGLIAAQIQKKRSATLLDDPLGFISAQFTLPADIETHNYYAQKHNDAEAELSQITKATNDAAITNNNMRQQTSAEAALAEQTKVAAAATLNIAKINIDMAGRRIEGIKELNSLTTQQAGLAYQALNAHNDQIRLALQAQSAADQHAARIEASKDRQERTDQKLSDRADLTASRMERNAGATAMGRATLDNIEGYIREYRANQKNPDYQAMISLGQQITLNKGSVTGISIAPTAGDAARMYAAGGVNLRGDPVATFLAKTYGEEAGKNLSVSIKSNPTGFADHVSTIAKSVAQTQLNSIDDQKDNMYRAPIPSILMQADAVKFNPFLAATVTPMVALNADMKLDGNTLMAKAIDFARGSPANFNVAAEGVAAYYKQAVITNNVLNRYVERGLPEQKQYTGKIDGKNIVLSDIAQVKRIMLMRGYKNSPEFSFPRSPNVQANTFIDPN